MPDLDLDTLLYACAAVVVLAAGVLGLFGMSQPTHPGFRHWVVAQWLLVAALLMQAVLGAHAWARPLIGLLVLQWPIVVLAGMRKLHMRNRPAIPPAIDAALLALAAVLVLATGLSDLKRAAEVGAFTLAAFGTTLYAAVVVSRLGGFQHSFALKSIAALLCLTAALQAVLLVLARLESTTPALLAAIEVAARTALVLPALGLVPIALALTYERTVAKMQATHRKLRHLADIDPLTRLRNRRHFHELAARTLATTEPAAAAVLMLDVENLKRINDLLGQQTGDEALRQVGLALRETLRARDVAGRLGGDEFAALLPNTSVADAVKVAGRITDHLLDRQVAPRTARLTLNVGAVGLRAGDTIVEALRRADIALDDARNHRNGRPVASRSAEDDPSPRPPPDLEAKPV
jgi:diguanylate cyclase (GGDEF)-like protein